jgi:UDP-glucuronate 4-epimerase
MRVLVTGAAGFIGYHVAHALLARGEEVIGLDNLSPYYDVGLKQARLALLQREQRFRFLKLDIADRQAMEEAFSNEGFERVVHLAAQAGVRHSLSNPHAYGDSNLIGFLNILEGCRRSHVAHCVFASSSSVYGANARLPFDVRQNVDHPLNLYAATKKSNELMAHAYAHLYRLPMTGLRFFTVYGPWGRPDMSPFLFLRKIMDGKPVDVFNHGRHRRDFTYIDDIVEGVLRTLDRLAEPNAEWSGCAPDPATSSAPFRLYNIGNNQPVELLEFIGCIEHATGRKAQLNMLPMQPGDMLDTCADVSDLAAAVGFQPHTPIEEGVSRLVAWYRSYYGV